MTIESKIVDINKILDLLISEESVLVSESVKIIKSKLSPAIDAVFSDMKDLEAAKTLSFIENCSILELFGILMSLTSDIYMFVLKAKKNKSVQKSENIRDVKSAVEDHVVDSVNDQSEKLIQKSKPASSDILLIKTPPPAKTNIEKRKDLHKGLYFILNEISETLDMISLLESIYREEEFKKVVIVME